MVFVVIKREGIDGVVGIYGVHSMIEGAGLFDWSC